MPDQPRAVWLTRDYIEQNAEHGTDLRADLLAAWDAAPADPTEAIVPVLFEAEANTPGVVITNRPLAEARCRRDAHAVLRALGMPDA